MALCYKDKTFCSSDCTQELCYRYASKLDFEQADRLNLPFAWSDFSDTCPDYRPGRDPMEGYKAATSGD